MAEKARAENPAGRVGRAICEVLGIDVDEMPVIGVSVFVDAGLGAPRVTVQVVDVYGRLAGVDWGEVLQGTEVTVKVEGLKKFVGPVSEGWETGG